MKDTDIRELAKESEEVRQKIQDYKCLVAALNSGEIPFYHRLCLTLDEAARYMGIGINRMREICDANEEVNIWNGSKRMIKRKELEDLIHREYSL